MADVLERSSQLIVELIKFMKTREMGDPLFTRIMPLLAKIRKDNNEATAATQKLNDNRDDAAARKLFDESIARLEKTVAECEAFLNPVKSKPSAVSEKTAGGEKPGEKKLLVPKELTFVSVDVQGSEDLKKDEEQSKVQSSFRAYQNLVDSCFKESKEFKAVKSAWAGDGFIAYFEKAGDAIMASMRLRYSMPVFNIGLNSLMRNFRIRIGISTGEDYFDEKLEIGKMTSHIIDLAGYLQKKASIENGPKTLSRIFVSVNTILKIHQNMSFRRVIKLDKLLIPADESKNVPPVETYELIF